LKIALPKDATILSAEVAGEKVKPVEGADGNRIPLLKPGFRPVDAYTVSFVFLHSGAPFAKKGGSDLALPKMDVPINILEWEVFLPEQYKVKDFGGDAIPANLLPPSSADVAGAEEFDSLFVYGKLSNVNIESVSLLPGQLGGLVVDSTGAVIPNTRITVTQLETGAVRNVVTDESGRWIVSNLTSGRVKVNADAPGFSHLVREIHYDGSRPIAFSFALNVGTITETVEVSTAALSPSENRRIEQGARKAAALQMNAASPNVTNLQQRVSGVLPVRIDVPRAGNSYHFVRPLVLDEETKVTFTYKSK